jgi:hypothetical protein
VPARDITVAALADDERIDPTEVAAHCCTRPLGTGADLGTQLQRKRSQIASHFLACDLDQEPAVYQGFRPS